MKEDIDNFDAADYLARAKQLRAKFLPQAKPVAVIAPPKPAIETRREKKKEAKTPWYWGDLEMMGEYRRCRAILNRAAERHGVTVNDILGPGRDTNLTRARHEAIVAVYQEIDWTLARMSRELRKDRVSIIHALQLAGVYQGDSEASARAVEKAKERKRRAFEKIKQDPEAYRAYRARRNLIDKDYRKRVRQRTERDASLIEHFADMARNKK